MVLQPSNEPWLQPQPEAAEDDKWHGNEPSEPRRGWNAGNRAIQESEDGNTQDQVEYADDLALAGSVHARFHHCCSGRAIKIG
jgi:hypothetical protein